MRETPPHLEALEQVEREGISGLVEVLREQGIDAVRYALWDATGWHRDYSPPAWRNRATEEQKRKGWEVAVRIEKIIAKVLKEAHERQSRRSWGLSPRGRRAFTRPTWTKEPRFRGFFSRRKGCLREPLSSKKAKRRASRTDYRQVVRYGYCAGTP